MDTKKTNIQGFTMIEILITIAIISAIVAISIPNMNRMRINANEQAAISTLKLVNSALDAYFDVNGRYPTLITTLATQNLIPGYLASRFNSPNMYQGYSFWYPAIAGSGLNFRCTANPSIMNVTGTRNFSLNETGVIIYQINATAWAALP